MYMMVVSASCYHDQIIKPFLIKKKTCLSHANVKRALLNSVRKAMV